ncbi:10478_t:CDS:1, partial [Entrophospora sp. SA101]
ETDKNERFRIGEHFEFWQNTDSKNWNYTSLIKAPKKNYNLGQK